MAVLSMVTIRSHLCPATHSWVLPLSRSRSVAQMVTYLRPQSTLNHGLLESHHDPLYRFLGHRAGDHLIKLVRRNLRQRRLGRNGNGKVSPGAI